jgi:hypothetical protein
MNNSNSLYNKYSRYVAGGSAETANGKIEWWERTIFQTDTTDIIYAVENFYENRLDLIASVFYNEPRYWWIIAQYNNILDPFSEITAGRVLRIPSKDRLSLMLSTRQGGASSAKQPINTISPIII